MKKNVNNVVLLFGGRLTGRYVSDGGRARRRHAQADKAWAEYRRWIANGGFAADVAAAEKAAADKAEKEARVALLSEYFGRKTAEERTARYERYVRRSHLRLVVAGAGKENKEGIDFGRILRGILRADRAEAALRELFAGRSNTAKSRRVLAAAEVGREEIRVFVNEGCKALVVAQAVRPAFTSKNPRHDIVVADGRDVFVINPTNKKVGDDTVELTYPIAGDNIGNTSFLRADKKFIGLATEADILAVKGLGEKTAHRIAVVARGGHTESKDFVVACGNKARFAALCDAFVFGDTTSKVDPEKVFEEVNLGERVAYAEQTIRNFQDRRSVKMQKICLSNKNDSHAEVMSYGMNKMTRRCYDNATGSFDVFNGQTHMVYNNVIGNATVKQPFTDEMIILELHEIGARAVDFIRQRGFRIVIAGGKAYAEITFLRRESESICVYPLCGGSRFTDSSEEFADYAKLRKDATVREYRCLYAGPSNMRGAATCFLFKVHDGEDRKALTHRMTSEFDELSGGLVTTIEKMIAKNGGMDYQKLFKLNSRISLPFTPMTPSFGARRFAYYNGEFGNSGYSDGQWIVSAEKLAGFFDVSAKARRHLALQARVIDGIIAKGMAIPMMSDDMHVVLGEYGQAVIVSYEQFRDLYIAGELKKDTMYLVGEVGEAPAYVFDKNTLKAVGSTPDPEGGFVFNILEVRRATEGKLNKQDASCLQHLEGFQDYLFNTGKRYIDAEVEKVQKLFAGKAKDGVINPDSYYPQLIADMCPLFAVHDAGLYLQIVNDLGRRLTKAISQYSIPSGRGDQYRYLQSDYANMFSTKGYKVLAENEVYIPGMKADTDVVLTRNPKSDVKEFYVAKTVSLDTIKERVEALDGASDALKEVILRAFKNASRALVITPAFSKVVNSLGGSDFDGDGCTVHVDPDFVALQLKEPEGSSEIPKAKPAHRLVKAYNIDVMQNMMVDGLFGQKRNGKRVAPTDIGTLSNLLDLIRAVRVLSEEAQKAILVGASKNMDLLGYERTNTPYVRRFTAADVKIDDNQVVEALEAFYTSDRSLDSFRAALDDAVRMASSVLGRAIDMAKNSDPVTTGMLAVLVGKDLNFEPIHSKEAVRFFCWDKVGVSCDIAQHEEDSSDYTMKYVVAAHPDDGGIFSKMTPVRNNLLTYAKDCVNDLLAKVEKIEDPKRLADEELVYADERVGVNSDDLHVIAKIHNTLVGNDKLQTEEKNDIRATIARMTRSVFSEGARGWHRFVAVRHAATKKKSDNENAIMRSTFQYVLKEEYMNGVLYVADKEHYDVNNQVGYRAFVRDSESVVDGEEVIIEDGKSLNDGSIVTDKKVTGRFYIVRDGNAFWLVKTAEDFFAIPQNVETMAEKASRHTRDGVKLVSREDDVAFLMEYDPSKKDSDFNKKLDISRKPGLAYIQLYANFHGLIFSNQMKDRYDFDIAHDGKGHIVWTNLNKALKDNLVKVSSIYQFEDDESYSIVLGRFCEGWNRNEGRHILPPWKKEIKGLQKM